MRCLRAGLPIRLVTALHDTSVKMIKAHYSAFITDMTEELARWALLLFDLPPTSNPSVFDYDVQTNCHENLCFWLL